MKKHILRLLNADHPKFIMILNLWLQSPPAALRKSTRQLKPVLSFARDYRSIDPKAKPLASRAKPLAESESEGDDDDDDNKKGKGKGKGKAAPRGKTRANAKRKKGASDDDEGSDGSIEKSATEDGMKRASQRVVVKKTIIPIFILSLKL